MSRSMVVAASALLVVTLLTSHSMVTMAESSPYNATFALAMAYMAGAAYCSKQSVLDWSCEACASTPPFNATMYLYDSDKNTAGFIGNYIEDPTTAVVSFRGTLPSSLKDWIDDLDFFKTDYALCNDCEVHKGFFESYGSLKETVLETLDRMKPDRVRVTGHSLGAAMAVFAAADIKHVGYDVEALYTFGEPRCGDTNFANAFDTTLGPSVSYRVVHSADIVPHLPPELFEFRHVEEEVWYTENNTYYKLCTTGDGEDPNCSDSVSIFDYSVEDHLHYMGIPISNLC